METLDLTKSHALTEPMYDAFIRAITTDKPGIAIPLSPDHKYEIELKISGVEVPFSKIVDALYNGFNATVDAAATEKVRNKFEQMCSLWPAQQLIDRFKDDLAVSIAKCLGVSCLQ